MKKYFFLTLCILFIAIIATGCIDELVPVGGEDTGQEMSAYEFEVFLNNSYEDGEFIPTHSFYLSNNGSVKVVSIIDNQSMVDVIPMEDLSTQNSEVLSNIVILGDFASNTGSEPQDFERFTSMEKASEINHTLSEEVIRGQKHIYIEFEEPVTGYVAYTMSIPAGQDFIYITTPPSVVRFILPEGYTTGNSLIGKVKPSPDEVYYDTSGRENLVWYNEPEASGFMSLLGRYTPADEEEIESLPEVISVKYYTENAPRDLGIAVTILGIIALFIFARYTKERKRLEKIRNDIEDNASISKRKGKD